MNITYWDAVLNLVNNTEISGPVNGPITEYTFHNNQTPPTEEPFQDFTRTFPETNQNLSRTCLDLLELNLKRLRRSTQAQTCPEPA